MDDHRCGALGAGGTDNHCFSTLDADYAIQLSAGPLP